MDDTTRSAALDRLELLAGDWESEARFSFAPEPGRGRYTFTWELGRRFLAMRADADHPDAPSALCLHSVDEDGDGSAFVQHYFDSRGVVRVYRMTLTDREWILRRTEPDFTPLAFSQRYVGAISADGRRIEGRWETSHDRGETWELDFELDLTRV